MCIDLKGLILRHQACSFQFELPFAMVPLSMLMHLLQRPLILYLHLTESYGV